MTDRPSPPPAASPPMVLTRDQVRRVDQIAIQRYRIPGIVLMENAARGAAEAIGRRWPPPADVLILCGGGNNGGDGLAIVRHLVNRGYDATIGLCVDPAKYAGDALTNWEIVRRMNVATVALTPEWLDVSAKDPTEDPDLVVDAIFGTGLTKPPRDPFPKIVAAVDRWRAAGAAVVAIDLPSGLDCDTGHPLGPAAVKADLTVTFVGLKAGFLRERAAAYTGQVVVADIGCPKEAVSAAMAGQE